MDRETAELLAQRNREWAVAMERGRRENKCVFTVCPPDDDLVAEVWCNIHTKFYYYADTLEECRTAAWEHSLTHE